MVSLKLKETDEVANSVNSTKTLSEKKKKKEKDINGLHKQKLNLEEHK